MADAADGLFARGYGFADRSFESIKQYLRDNNIEGIVFWLDGEPKCKIKRTDFGFVWNPPVRKKRG